MASTPLFPLGRALFPSGVLHLRIFEVRYLDMIKKCIADGTAFGVVPLLEGREVRVPGATETLAAAGTLARIDSWEAPMPGLLTLRCVGTTRFRLASAELLKHGLWMGVLDPLADDPAVDVPADLQPAADALGRFIARLQRDGVPAAGMPLAAPFRLDECGWVADRWAELLPLPSRQQEELLTLQDPRLRLQRIHSVLEDLDLLS